MNIFLSWSGERTKQVAELLKNWLPEVIQAAEPWSSTDIDKGKDWLNKISQALDATNIGIIILDKYNFKQGWIFFEAGALAKKAEGAYLCTFLLDLDPSILGLPLSIFQCTQFEKEDVRRMVSDINKALKLQGAKALSDNKFNKAFDRVWPDFEHDLNDILKHKFEDSASTLSSDEFIIDVSNRDQYAATIQSDSDIDKHEYTAILEQQMFDIKNRIDRLEKFLLTGDLNESIHDENITQIEHRIKMMTQELQLMNAAKSEKDEIIIRLFKMLKKSFDRRAALSTQIIKLKAGRR